MKKVLVNTGSNVCVMFVKLVITFIMTPVLLHNLGNYDYGIWEILVAILGYMGLLDIGMKPAIARFAAKYHALEERGKLQELYSTAWMFLLIVGACLCVFFIMWGMFWPNVLAETPSPQVKYSLLLFIIGVQLLIVFPGYVAESFLEGFQKYYLINNITIFNSIVGAVILYVFIEPVNALVLLAGVNAVGLSVKYLVYTYLLMGKNYGGLKPRIFTASWVSFKEIIGFGVKSLIQGIASRVEIGTDTIVIGYFLGPAIVPLYAIPANLLSYIRNIGWTITHAFMPLFSALSAQNQELEIQRIYLGASRYVVALLLPLCIGATLVGGAFIGVWIGAEYQKDAETIILLLVVFVALPFLNPFSTRYLTAIGRHGLLAKLYPISALVNILASIILVQYWGIIGVALGSAMPVLIVVPIVLKMCCGYLNISVTRYLQQSVWPAVLPTIGMWGSVYMFCQYWPLIGYTEIVAAVVIGAIVYGVLFYIMGMNQSERLWLKSNASRLFAR